MSVVLWGQVGYSIDTLYIRIYGYSGTILSKLIYINVAVHDNISDFQFSMRKNEENFESIVLEFKSCHHLGLVKI